jgi:hypothetical protein
MGNNHTRYLVTGTTNTGKTHLCTRLAKRILEKAAGEEDWPFDQVIIISPNYKFDDQIKSFIDYCIDTHQLHVKVYENMQKPATMAKFVNYMVDSKSRDLRTLIYFDDPVGLAGMTDNVNRPSPFNSFISGVKFYNATVIFSTQDVGAMARTARKNMEVFIFLPAVIDRKTLHETCPVFETPIVFGKMMDKYAGEAYTALWINIQGGRKGIFSLKANGSVSPITTLN